MDVQNEKTYDIPPVAQAGKDVQVAWETLISPDGHTKEEIQEAYETVVEKMKEASDPLSQLSGLQWSFSSGAGGWSTELQTTADGSFSGQYHDSEMGEAADDYPNGTVYCCSFKGQMSFVEYVDGHTWKIRVDHLTIDDASEAIDDGIRFVPTEPYGISAGDEMLLFLPGTPVDVLTEDMRTWAHLLGEDAPDTLEDWFLYSEKNSSGFVGYKI